MVIIC